MACEGGKHESFIPFKALPKVVPNRHERPMIRVPTTSYSPDQKSANDQLTANWSALGQPQGGGQKRGTKSMGLEGLRGIGLLFAFDFPASFLSHFSTTFTSPQSFRYAVLHSHSHPRFGEHGRLCPAPKVWWKHQVWRRPARHRYRGEAPGP